MMGFELKDVGEGGDLDAQVVGEAIVRTLMTMAFEAGQEMRNEGASLSDTVLGNDTMEIAFAMKDACHKAMISGSPERLDDVCRRAYRETFGSAGRSEER